jgi:hypothetical protein
MRRDSRFVVIVATIFFIVVILSIHNGRGAIQMFSLDSLSYMKKIELFFSVFFDWKSTFTRGTIILGVLGSLLAGINLSLAYTYIQMRGKLIVASGLYSGFGLIFAFLGIGCAACGTAMLSVIVSFFGLSSFINVLPYQGEEIGYIGLMLLAGATYTLSQKVMAGAVC